MPDADGLILDLPATQEHASAVRAGKEPADWLRKTPDKLAFPYYAWDHSNSISDSGRSTLLMLVGGLWNKFHFTRAERYPAPSRLSRLGAKPKDPRTGQEARFVQLVDKWRDETTEMSSVHDMVSHPAYLQIIAMGSDVIPLILEELGRERNHWFVALHALSGGENPVRYGDRGNLSAMTEAWLEWGRSRGHFPR